MAESKAQSMEPLRRRPSSRQNNYAETLWNDFSFFASAASGKDDKGEAGFWGYRSKE